MNRVSATLISTFCDRSNNSTPGMNILHPLRTKVNLEILDTIVNTFL